MVNILNLKQNCTADFISLERLLMSGESKTSHPFTFSTVTCKNMALISYAFNEVSCKVRETTMCSFILTFFLFR